MLSHAVYFTLKNRSPQAAADLVAACQSHLAGHPGTLFFAAKSTPATPAKEAQPSPAPKGGKNAAVNSRDAAAEALKKFFNNR